MSYRLYPDIIVAAKIIDSYRRYPDLSQTYVSVNSCLVMQDMCKQMGIENVFTGSETKTNWDEIDYDKFFRSFSQYFEKANDDFYRVKFEIMLNIKNKEVTQFTELDLIEVIKNKIIQYPYSDRLLSYVGLN